MEMATWINHPVKGLVCSNCGEHSGWCVTGITFARSFAPYRSDYCPHCGKPMRCMCEKCVYFSTCDRKNPICGEREDDDNNN